MKKQILQLLYLFLTAVVIWGCNSSNSASAQYKYQDPSFYEPQVLQTVDAQINGHNLKLMLAKSDFEKAKGLMFYKKLSSDTGMLFVYNYSHKMTFWMMNTRIPLDLIFFSEDLKVTEYIKRMEPGYGKKTDALPHYNSNEPARYALELNAGSIEELDIKIGDKLEIPQILLYSDY